MNKIEENIFKKSLVSLIFMPGEIIIYSILITILLIVAYFLTRNV